MIKIEVNDQGVHAALNRLQAASRDLSPAARAIAGLLHDRTEQNFASESGPTGSWAKLKRPSKRRSGGKILQDTGRLAASIVPFSGADFAQVGTNAVYAAIHQLGGDIQIAARSQQAYFHMNKRGEIGNRFVKKGLSNFAQWHTRGAHTVHMPARPYLPVTPTGQLQAGIEGQIAETLRRYITGGSL